MEELELAELKRTIENSRKTLEASRGEVLELEQHVVQARRGGHVEWVASLEERRAAVEQRVERLSSSLDEDEERYRLALAN